MPKGFFPQQDTGRLTGSISGAQDISFPAMREKLAAFVDIVQHDPAVDNVVGFTGGSSVNTGRMFVQLKRLERAQRRHAPTGDQPAARRSCRAFPARRCSCRRCRISASAAAASNAQYQYTLRADNLERPERLVAAAAAEACARCPSIRDANTDQQNHGLQTQRW